MPGATMTEELATHTPLTQVKAVEGGGEGQEAVGGVGGIPMLSVTVPRERLKEVAVGAVDRVSADHESDEIVLVERWNL